MADLPKRSLRLKRKIEFVDDAFAAFRYEFPITDIVKAAKFHGDLGALTVLATAFTSEFLAELQDVDILVPVPLLPWRFLRRGFNQSSELARQLSLNTRLLVQHDIAARRQAWGLAQSRLDAAARVENVRSAFTIKRNVTGARIAIVDDVITTGATCASLAKALHCAGAARIVAVAVAATPRRHA